MNRLTRRDLFAASLALGIAPMARSLFAQAPPGPSGQTIDDFFRDFTADWVRHDPNLAASSRYFTGDEQDHLERQLTPRTLEWRRDRIQRARQGLAELQRFDRGRMIEGRLGQLDAEFFRARRLVVDTGLHARKWTRRQSIDYGIEASEVERYAVYPGQACSYMIGELKIIELREKAKQALGDRFSLRDFHNTVLRTGTVPLEVLAREVDRYVSPAAKSR